MPTATNLPAVATGLAERLDQHGRLAELALAANTRRAFASDSAIFTAWCAAHDLAPLPASADAVAAYVRALADGWCRHDCAACCAWHTEQYNRWRRWQPWHRSATISRHVATVAAMHRAAGIEPPTASETVRLTLKGTRRALGTRQKQAPALRWNHARQMLAALDSERLIDLRDAALLSVALDTAGRRAEIVALDVADMAIDADGFGRVLIRRSKSDQEGQGRERQLMPDTARRVAAWLTAAGITDGPIFRTVSKAQRTGRRLEAGDVHRIFNRLAERAGLPPTFTGHSTRVGFAQDWHDAGCTDVEIQLGGGWKSAEMIGRYCRNLDMKRTARRVAALQNRL